MWEGKCEIRIKLTDLQRNSNPKSLNYNLKKLLWKMKIDYSKQ